MPDNAVKNLDRLFTPQPPSAPAPAREPVAPRPLCRQGLAELRDMMCEESFFIAASSAELELWLGQLDAVIDAGEVDPRPSWVLAEEAEAKRIAAIVVAELRTADTAALLPAAAKPEPQPTQMPEPEAQAVLVRARDVGMTPREWRAAIHRGELRAKKVGRGYRATREDFAKYLDARQVAPKQSRPRVQRTDPVTAAVDRALASGRLRVVRGGE